MENIEDYEVIKRVYETCDMDTSADVLAELLMDPECSSWKMFEELAAAYVNGSDEVREGIDTACSILTGWKLASIARQISERLETETQQRGI